MACVSGIAHNRRMPTKKTPHAPAVADLDETDAARYLNFQPTTLKAWRRLGRGPAYYRVYRSVRYRLEDLDAWRTDTSVRVEPDPARDRTRREKTAARDAARKRARRPRTLAPPQEDPR